jgi:tetratricopeptide (TPR) repeat protein
MSVREGLSAHRPFPGLRPFDEKDSPYFFGREEQIFALYSLLELNQFVAVVGSSGSGKSSLVRAGLLPLLRRGTAEVEKDDDPEPGLNWKCVTMQPGDAPLRRLAEGLAELDATKTEDPTERAARRERIDYVLRRSSFGVTEAITGIPALDGRPLLIVVDQLEELFRYQATGDTRARVQEERDQFVQLLLEATNGRPRDVHVLITMRSDFIGDCTQFNGLPEVVSTCQFLVPSLTRQQREEIIRCPLDSKHANSTVEPALVEQLLNDAGSELDQLPVLQHCLSRLWDIAGPSSPTTPHRQLRREHYTQIGGIADALSQHADLILEALKGHEIAVQQVFRALSEVDDEGRATRRALPYWRLRAESGIEEAELRMVIDRFRDDDCAFLVPSLSTLRELDDDTVIDIGHEALLRRWKKIAAIVSDEALVFHTESTWLQRSLRRVTGSHAHRTAGITLEQGWLQAEINDARFYRAMLTMRRTLPPDLVAEKWAWWNERPRTTAWAERYGGGKDRVDQLLKNSRSAKSWRRIGSVGSLIAGVLAVVAVVSLIYQNDRQQKQQQVESRIRFSMFKELTDMTEDMSSSLRFLPGANIAFRQLLDHVKVVSNNYIASLNNIKINAHDEQLINILHYTMLMLEADYDINFGKIGLAIKNLKEYEVDLQNAFPSEDPHRGQRALRLLEAEIQLHRANGEAIYGAPNDANRDYEDAQKSLLELISDESSSSNPSEVEFGLNYADRAQERLADVYKGRMFLELKFLKRPEDAAKDFDSYKKLVKEQLELHPSDDDQVRKYWGIQQQQLRRWQADTWAGQGHLDEAIDAYRELLKKNPERVNVLFEVGRAYTRAQLALALIRRARDSDIAEALGHLRQAKDVFDRLVTTDAENAWWPLITVWVDRASGEAYLAQHNSVAASDAFEDAVQLDLRLVKLDADNQRASNDLKDDTDTLTRLKDGE